MTAIETSLYALASAGLAIFACVSLGTLVLALLINSSILKKMAGTDRWIVCVASGLPLLAILTWLLGSLGLMNLLPALILCAAFPGIWAVLGGKMSFHYPPLIFNSSRLSQTVGFSLITVTIALAGTTIYPHSHGDALYYHLSSAWIWMENNQISHIDWMPWYLQGGLGEYFYATLATISRDKMTFLIAGQICHFFFGYLLTVSLTVLLCYRLLTETAKFHGLTLENQRALALVASCAMALMPEGISFLTHAKNDGFVLLYELLSLNLLISSEKTWREKSLIVASAAIAFKSSALFFVIPFSIVYLVQNYSRNQINLRLFLHLVAALVMGGAVPLRNYILTGSPFFPAMTSHFPSPLIDGETRKIVAAFTKPDGSLFDALMTQGHRYFWAMPFYLLAPLGALSFFRKNTTTKIVAAIHFGSLALFLAIAGQGTSARFLLAAYATGAGLSALGVVAIHRYLQKISPSWGARRLDHLLVLILIIGIIPWSNIEIPFVHCGTRTFAYLKSNQTSFDWFADRKPILKIQDWINKHRKQLENMTSSPLKILSTMNNQNLFLDVPLSVPENEIRASRVKHAIDYEHAVQAFCHGGFTHMLVDESLIPGYMDQLIQAAGFETDFPIEYSVNGYQLRSAVKCRPVTDSRQSTKPATNP